MVHADYLSVFSCHHTHQPGVFAQLMMAAEERPWLWVIYILTVGLPIGLLVLFCWPKVHTPRTLERLINLHILLFIGLRIYVNGASKFDKFG